LNTETPLLEVNHLITYIPSSRGEIRPVNDISFSIKKGEIIALVGESGSGKSVSALSIMGLNASAIKYHPDSSILFEGQDLLKIKEKELRRIRGNDIAMIFQDPISSLNPVHPIGKQIAESIVLHKVGTKNERRKRVDELLERVGLATYHGRRYPIEFSGGQRQRIGIARALALQPKLIVCDEPVSALDVSIQAQILNLLKEIQNDMGLSYLFIAHGIQVVKHISDKIAVMYLGKISEFAEKEELFANPHHPYTKALLSAVPLPDPKLRDRERIILKGDLPSSANPPTGCRFHTRCPVAME